MKNPDHFGVEDDFSPFLFDLFLKEVAEMLSSVFHFLLLKSFFDVDHALDAMILANVPQEEQETQFVGFDRVYAPDHALNQLLNDSEPDIFLHPGVDSHRIPINRLLAIPWMIKGDLLRHAIDSPNQSLKFDEWENPNIGGDIGFVVHFPLPKRKDFGAFTGLIDKFIFSPLGKISGIYLRWSNP